MLVNVRIPTRRRKPCVRMTVYSIPPYKKYLINQWNKLPNEVKSQVAVFYVEKHIPKEKAFKNRNWKDSYRNPTATIPW